MCDGEAILRRHLIAFLLDLHLVYKRPHSVLTVALWRAAKKQPQRFSNLGDVILHCRADRLWRGDSAQCIDRIFSCTSNV
jgi:hypothetical protein